MIVSMLPDDPANPKRDDLKQLNDGLLKRREAEKEEAIKKYGAILSAIRELLEKGEYGGARTRAMELRETPLLGDVLTLFQNHPEPFHCPLCCRPMEGIVFRKDSLTWIRPHHCDECSERRREQEQVSQDRAFALFIEKNMVRILEAVGVTGRLLLGSYEGLPPEIVHICRRSAMGKHGLYIHGGVGTGKSCLTAAVLKDILQAAKFPSAVQKRLMRDVAGFREFYRFLIVPDLLKDIKSTYGTRDYAGEQRVIEECTQLSVLILDDIGMEKPSQWVREKLTRIVDYRNNRELKTFYTSNIDPQALKDHVDERMASRIFQQCEIINLTGPDRRRL